MISPVSSGKYSGIHLFSKDEKTIYDNHSVTPAENYIFEKDQNSDGLALCGYVGKEKIVILPEEVNGIKVVSITNKAFGANSGVRAIKIVGPAIHIFNKDFVIGGKAGSKAEEYAKLFRYPFEVTE